MQKTKSTACIVFAFVILCAFILGAGCSSVFSGTGSGHVPNPALNGTIDPVYENYTSENYRFSMQYPSGWVVQETDPASCLAVRDYGKKTCAVVTFYSPKPDESGYSAVRVDVGAPFDGTLEEYFNQATVALEDLYHPLTLTRNNFQAHIANRPAYRLDYLKKNDPDRAGTAAFAMTMDHIPYIIVADNGNLDETMLESFTILPSTLPNATAVSG